MIILDYAPDEPYGETTCWGFSVILKGVLLIFFLIMCIMQYIFTYFLNFFPVTSFHFFCSFCIFKLEEVLGTSVTFVLQLLKSKSVGTASDCKKCFGGNPKSSALRLRLEQSGVK